MVWQNAAIAPLALSLGGLVLAHHAICALLASSLLVMDRIAKIACLGATLQQYGAAAALCVLQVKCVDYSASLRHNATNVLLENILVQELGAAQGVRWVHIQMCRALRSARPVAMANTVIN